MSRAAIVTGASSGIGRAAAKIMLERGWEVVATARRQDRLEELGAIAVAGDLADPALDDQLDRALPQAEEIALVHAAGSGWFGAYDERPFEDWQKQIELNLIAPMRLTHTLMPRLKAAKPGRVILVSSIAARHSFPGAGSYAASKAGLIHFGRSLAAECRADGLRVTSILPGAADTELWGEECPPREEMLSADSVGELIADIADLPVDRVLEEAVITPPKGIL